MKFKLTLLCLCLWGFTALSAQDMAKIKLKGNYQNKLLDLVMLDLEINYRLRFKYDRALTEDVRITASFGKLPLEDALTQLFKNTKIGFELEAPRTIVLIPKTEMSEMDWSKVEPTRRDFTLKGIVKDSKSGESLPFASVMVKGTYNGVTTNVDGYFTLFNVPADTVVLVVSYIGYQNRLVRISPETDIENVKVELEDFSVALEEVVVKATREEQMLSASTGISRIALAPAALAKLPSYGEKDIFRSLQLLPGISGSNESSSGLYVRGGTPDQNLVLFDGFTVYHVDHLFGFFSAFNTNAIKDVQLYKGGFDAKYGGRLSSVVEMTGKDGNTEAFNMGVGLSLLSVNGFVEAPFAKGKGSFLVAGRRSFQSDFYNNIFEAYTDSNEASNDGPPQNLGRFGQQEVQPNTYFYDLNAKVTYRLNSRDVFSLSFYNGEDNLDNSRNLDQDALAGRFGGNLNFNFQRESTDLTAWGNWGGSAKWSRRWNDRFYSNANFSYSNYYSERNRSDQTFITRADTTVERNTGSYELNDLKDLSFKLDNELKINQNNQLDFGWQTTWNDIEYTFTQNDTISVLDRADEGLTSALYIQDRHTFGNRLVVKGGLRTSFYSPTEQIYLEPRASLSYLLSEKIRLKAAWGKYYQFANRIVREDIQQGSRDFWLLADDDNVSIGSAFHHIVGLSYETKDWLFDVEGYYKTLDGLSEYSTRFVTTGFGPDRQLDYEEFFYTGTGIAKGLEFLAQKKVGRLNGWIGYTLGEVKYDFPIFGDTPFPANQDVTHELKIIGSYQLGKVTFGATFIYATGRPYTAPTGYYELTLLDGTTSSFFEVSNKNSLRYPDYHRLDISATYDFTMGTSQASAGLSITNLYNRKNAWYNEYEVIEGELIETKVSLLGITPSFFFTWTLR